MKKILVLLLITFNAYSAQEGIPGGIDIIERLEGEAEIENQRPEGQSENPILDADEPFVVRFHNEDEELNIHPLLKQYITQTLNTDILTPSEMNQNFDIKVSANKKKVIILNKETGRSIKISTYKKFNDLKNNNLNQMIYVINKDKTKFFIFKTKRVEWLDEEGFTLSERRLYISSYDLANGKKLVTYQTYESDKFYVVSLND